MFTQKIYSKRHSNLFPSFFFSEQGLKLQCVIESSGAWTFYSCNLCKYSSLSLHWLRQSWWKQNVIISVLPPGWWQDLYTVRWTTRSPSKWRIFTFFQGQLLQPSVRLGSGNQWNGANRNVLQTSTCLHNAGMNTWWNRYYSYNNFITDKDHGGLIVEFLRSSIRIFCECNWKSMCVS